MSAQTKPGGAIDPDDPKALSDAWNKVAMKFQRMGASQMMLETYAQAIARLLELQKSDDRRYHKGMFLHNLALGYVATGRPDVALWFHRLAFVEDALSRPKGDNARPETPATAMLRLYHGVSNDALDDWLNQIGHAEELDQKNPLERIKARHPEVSVVEIALADVLGASRQNSSSDIPVNSWLLQDLDDTLDDTDANVKGVNLERLATYLCLTLPGARVKNRVSTKIGELDLIVVLREAANSYFVETLGRTLLVECKNWGDPVGVQQINHLAARVRLHGCRTGILIATKGISGTRVPGEQLAFGQLLVQGWFHQDGIIIGVIDRQTIRALESTFSTFADLILSRFDELRFAYASQDFT